MSQTFREEAIYRLADEWVNDSTLNPVELSHRLSELSTQLARLSRQLGQCVLLAQGADCEREVIVSRWNKLKESQEEDAL